MTVVVVVESVEETQKNVGVVTGVVDSMFRDCQCYVEKINAF